MTNMNLIRSISWKFAQNTNLQYEELFSEAALAYCEAVKTYDPDKGAKLVTYAYWCMKNRLINFSKKETKINNQNFFYESIPEYYHPHTEIERDFNFQEFTEDWSDECRELAQVALEKPEKFLGETPDFKRSGGKKDRIRKELRRRGWLHKEINMAMKEMSLRIQTI